MATMIVTAGVATAAFGLLAGAFALAASRGRPLVVGCGAAHAYARAHDLLVDDDADCGCGCGGREGCGEAEIVAFPQPAARPHEAPRRAA